MTLMQGELYLDACSKVCGIYLDLQKAFDSVSLDILLEKMYINTDIHCYNTRIKEDIHVACPKLSTRHKCLKAKAGSLWNALPSYLKNNMSTGVFK
jgi:hypothetical protein